MKGRSELIKSRIYKDIINNQNQMIKLVYGCKNKIVKLDKIDYKGLQALIRQSFPEAPVDFLLSYIDQDKDQISLGSDEDLTILMSSGLKINKIYIKQSLSQTIEMTDNLEPSFEIYETNPKKIDKQEIMFKVNNPFEKQESKVSDVIQIKPPIEEKKSIQISVPVEEYHSFDEGEQKQSEKIPEKIQQPLLSQEIKKVQLPSEPKQQIKVDREQERSQNNKSFILSIADSNKIQIGEDILNERIYQSVKKILQIEKKEQKKEEQKKQVQNPDSIVQNKQILDVEKPRMRSKIFDQVKPLQKKIKLENDLIYHGVICSFCKDQYGIIGVRYQCIFCDDFNLCSSCENSIEHEHPLLKVKFPKQTFRKEQIIEKYRNEMFSNMLAPGHYVPSISKDEAKKYLETSKAMVKESMERAQRMVDDMFLKLELSHKNPYELQKPIHVPVETMKEKMAHLVNLFGIQEREARYFCEIHKASTKEELTEIYIKKKTTKII